MITFLLFLTLLLNIYTTSRIFILKYKSKLAYFLLFFNVTMLVSTTNALLQSLLPIEYINNLGTIFENFSAISLIFFAPILFTTFMFFYKPTVNLKNLLYLYALPLFSLFTLWTNDFHNLYFAKYSIYYQDIIYGKMYLVNLFYSILLYIAATIGFSYLAYYKQNKYQKISKIFLGYNALYMVYIFLNLTSVIQGNRLFTPIIFSPFAFIFTLGVMELNLVNIFPIATKQITNIMSDPFLLLTPKGKILEMNNAFIKNIISSNFNLNIGDNFLIKLKENNKIDYSTIIKLIKKSYKTNKIQTIEYSLTRKKKTIYYDIDLQTILDDSQNCISILLIFKNTTKQKNDLLTIEHDHEILTLQQQMSTVGELASGFAHDINTPITAIKTGISILKCNPNITKEDLNKLLKMEKEANKIIDFSTNIRSQIREIGNTEKTIFSINNLIKNIITISNAELKQKNCYITFNEEDTCFAYGNLSKLSQVILNIVSNSINAYKKDGEIIITLRKTKQKTYIEIQDFAGGIKEDIAKNIFKKVLSSTDITKSGMGLYISNSIIKSLFNGDITFTTNLNEGTTFIITLPIPKEVQ